MNYMVLALSIILSKVIPHPAGITPLFAVTLLLGAQSNKLLNVTILLVSLLIGDIATASIYQYPVFGDWTLFVYSGLLLNLLLGNFLRIERNIYKVGLIAINGCLLFWLWTNFGTWLLSGIYPQNPLGLFTCYVAAIPFLGITTVLNSALVLGCYRVTGRLNRSKLPGNIAG